MPFLPWLVKNDCPPDMNLYVLFASICRRALLDYLMFAYNKRHVYRLSGNDVTLKISTVRYVVQYTLQAAVLLIFSITMPIHPAAADGDPQQRGGCICGPEALPGHRVSG